MDISPLRGNGSDSNTPQLAFEEWQPRSLVRIYETKNGEVYKTYQSNTKELIALFRFVREEMGETASEDGEDVLDKIAREAREKYPVVESGAGRMIADDRPVNTDEPPLISEEEMEEYGYNNRN